jgi:hypothetical protein
MATLPGSSLPNPNGIFQFEDDVTSIPVTSQQPITANETICSYTYSIGSGDYLENQQSDVASDEEDYGDDDDDAESANGRNGAVNSVAEVPNEEDNNEAGDAQGRNGTASSAAEAPNGVQQNLNGDVQSLPIVVPISMNAFNSELETTPSKFPLEGGGGQGLRILYVTPMVFKEL